MFAVEALWDWSWSLYFIYSHAITVIILFCSVILSCEVKWHCRTSLSTTICFRINLELGPHVQSAPWVSPSEMSRKKNLQSFPWVSAFVKTWDIEYILRCVVCPTGRNRDKQMRLMTVHTVAPSFLQSIIDLYFSQRLGYGLMRKIQGRLIGWNRLNAS